MVTFSTVGYGDRVALSNPGRLVTILIILVGVSFIGSTLSQIFTLVVDHRKYQQFQSQYPRSSDPHIVICGDLTYSKIRTILTELCEGKHYQQMSVKIVILAQEPPSTELQTYLSSPFMASVVTYLVGRVENPADLRRISLDRASSCFILSSGDKDTEARDAATVLKAIAIKELSSSIANRAKSLGKRERKPSILCQLHNKQFQKYVSRKGIRSFCLGELKTLILAYNMGLPGFCTFISSLCLADNNSKAGNEEWHVEFESGKTTRNFFCLFSIKQGQKSLFCTIFILSIPRNWISLYSSSNF